MTLSWTKPWISSFFRSDLMNLAKVLMATPAVVLLGVDFYRRVQEATNPQRQVLMITFVSHNLVISVLLYFAQDDFNQSILFRRVLYLPRRRKRATWTWTNSRRGQLLLRLTDKYILLHCWNGLTRSTMWQRRFEMIKSLIDTAWKMHFSGLPFQYIEIGRKF